MNRYTRIDDCHSFDVMLVTTWLIIQMANHSFNEDWRTSSSFLLAQRHTNHRCETPFFSNRPFGQTSPVITAHRCNLSGFAPRLRAQRLQRGTVKDHQVHPRRNAMDPPNPLRIKATVRVAELITHLVSSLTLIRRKLVCTNFVLIDSETLNLSTLKNSSMSIFGSLYLSERI